MDREIGPDPFAALKEGSEEYHVYDKHYERIGRVDDVFIDERDAVSYVGIKMGFFGTNSTLVPVEIVRVNDLRRLIEVDEDAETIKHAPHFGHDETVSPELEDRVRTYFGLEPLLTTDARGDVPSRRHDPLRPRRQGGHRAGREGGGPGACSRAAGRSTGSRRTRRCHPRGPLESRDQRGWRRLPPQEESRDAVGGDPRSPRAAPRSRCLETVLIGDGAQQPSRSLSRFFQRMSPIRHVKMKICCAAERVECPPIPVRGGTSV